MDFNAIAYQLKVELARHKALAEAAQVLEQIGSLDNAKKELEAKHADLSEKVREHSNLLDEMKDHIEGAKATAASMLKEAHDQVASMAANAEAAAQAHWKQTQDECATVLAGTRAEAKALWDKAVAEEKQVQESIDAKRAELMEVAVQWGDKVKELHAAQEALANVKAAASKILG